MSEEASINSDEKPDTVVVEVKVKYLCQSLQTAIDNGVNGFAVTLLAESLGDKDMLIEGGVMFNYPYDHKKRPIWIIVTGEAPFVKGAEAP